jgi:hypothetical protein
MSFEQIWDIFFLGFFCDYEYNDYTQETWSRVEKKKKAANGWVLIGIKERIWQHNITYSKKRKGQKPAIDLVRLICNFFFFRKFVSVRALYLAAWFFGLSGLSFQRVAWIEKNVIKRRLQGKALLLFSLGITRPISGGSTYGHLKRLQKFKRIPRKREKKKCLVCFQISKIDKKTG